MITFFKVIFDFYVMLDYHMDGIFSSLRFILQIITYFYSKHE